MPAEWAQHERTLMAWPCRTELWGPVLGRARQDTAAVANAIAAFEPVTMVARPADAGAARAALAGAVEVVALPIDDSWLRDTGPVFVLDEETGERAAVHFRFNAWGERFAPYAHDAAVGAVLAERLGDPVRRAPLVLEGGAIAVDGTGTLLATEQCLLHPNRNPDLDRPAIEAALREHLGAERVVWLGEGLAEDRDTDGHVDLVAAFTGPGRVLLQTAAEGNPNHARGAENAARARAAGLDVVELDLLPYVTVAGERVAAGHLNLYVCNGAVIVPVTGAGTDAEALARIGAEFAGREVVGVPGAVLAYGGGGPHCVTQQVPARPR
jgi:agmatine deiminase